MPDTLFDVVLRREADSVVLEAAGELDISTSSAFADGLDAALVDTAPLLLVDLTRTTFFGAVGIDLLEEAISRGERAGMAVRVRPSAVVRRILDLVDFPEGHLIPSGRRHRLRLELNRRASAPHLE